MADRKEGKREEAQEMRREGDKGKESAAKERAENRKEPPDTGAGKRGPGKTPPSKGGKR